VLLLALFVVPMGLSGTSVALPSIARDLSADEGLLQATVNGFNIAFAVGTLAWGILSDRIGHRRVFRLGVLAYLAAALMNAAARDFTLMIVGRALAGIAGAAIFTSSAAIITTLFTGSARARLFSLYGSTIGLGLAAGPSVGGALIGLVGWRGEYLAHASVLALALAGSVAIPALRRTAHATRIFDMAIVANPRFLALCLVAVAGSIGFVTTLTYLPTAITAIGGLDAGWVGVLMLALTIPVLLGPLLGVWLSRALPGPSQHIVIFGGLGLMLGGLLGLLRYGPESASLAVTAPATLVGLGFGLSLGLIDAEALTTVPAAQSGTAAGILNFFRMGSEAVFVALYGVILYRGVASQLPDASSAQRIASGVGGHPGTYAHAFHTTVATLITLLAITITAIAALTARRRSTSPMPEPAPARR
jgi:MFS family permease